jgi:serine protease AprX
MGTASTSDDTITPFSAFGTTESGFAKPDLVAPGMNIVSTLASRNGQLAQLHPGHIVDDNYFRMSGTSMSSPIVAGAAALLLQDEPTLNPDQVKYRLKATARPFNSPGAGAGYLDIYAATRGTTTATANTGIAASRLLWTGNQPVTWGSLNWGSVNWGSVNWGSVNWGSVNWGSVNWGNVDYWNP